MNMVFTINFCKLYLALLTVFMVIIGVLINICEPYLPVLFTRTFRYGKFACKEESALVRKLEVPKSYFRHFYSTAAFIYCPLILREVLNVYLLGGMPSEWLLTLLDFSCGYQRTASVSATSVFIATILLVLQILRRFYDTHFVSVFSKTATINFSHYFVGLTYYPIVILIMLSEAPIFAHEINGTKKMSLSDIGFLDVFAIILFMWAWYHQHVASVILANLRKNKKGEVVTQSYQLPQGDWFNYLSAPHSTAEMIMYTALTILLFNNTGWWYVYAWVISNQVETILLGHWWYQSNFKNFPQNRKALIPFIY